VAIPRGASTPHLSPASGPVHLRKSSERGPLELLTVQRSWLRTLASVTWQTKANLGRHGRTGVDGRGWLWEIARPPIAERIRGLRALDGDQMFRLVGSEAARV
jgi:hypothetical protein